MDLATEVLTIETLVDDFANGITNVLIRQDPLLQRARVFEDVKSEAWLAATDMAKMVLGVPDPDEEYQRDYGMGC